MMYKGNAKLFSERFMLHKLGLNCPCTCSNQSLVSLTKHKLGSSKMWSQNTNANEPKIDLHELIPELPKGPLDEYRQRATFDWRLMKLFLDRPKNIKFKNKIWNFLRSNPIFDHPPQSPTMDELRHLTNKRLAILNTQKFFKTDEIVSDPSLVASENEAIFSYDASLAVKQLLTFRLCANTIRGMGQPHHYEYIEKLENADIRGCFALTEVAHGSNAKGMKMTASFDVNKKQFILNSPDFQAAKCWVGSLGQCATHAVVYAILVSKGKQYGLHAYIVPIRDPVTLMPYPGVIVGDIGEKIGLNGVDNGFLMFNNYAIQFENQLNRLGGINLNGDYESPYSDPNRRFGASLGVLSGGRVHITSFCCNNLQKAIVIAIRYSGVRRQFANENSDVEIPIIEYQQQQIRLVPYVAVTFALRSFGNWFSYTHAQNSIKALTGVTDEDAGIRGIEIHALSSAIKPLAGWIVKDGLQNCREACGGHGYLKVSGIGDLRNENDANITYEGENSVLVQQASNWLLSLWPNRLDSNTAKTPYGSVEFLKDADNLLNTKLNAKTVDSVAEPQNLVNVYKWLLAYLLKETYDKVTYLKSKGKNSFEAKNESQAYNAVTLSLVYGESFILNHFFESAQRTENPNVRKVLLKLVSLFGTWMLEKHLSTLYIGGHFSSDDGILLREAVLKLCTEIAPDSIALVDALAPPDFILKSALGNADGEVYKNLENAVMTYPGALSRPNWWKDVVHWQTYVNSKL